MAHKMGITDTGRMEVPARHFPHFSRRNLRIVMLAVALLAGITLLVLSQTIWKNASLPIPPAQVPSTQGGAIIALPTPTPTPVVPTIPEVRVEWVYIGQARNGSEVLALPIPWEKISIMEQFTIWEVSSQLESHIIKNEAYWQDRARRDPLGLRNPTVGRGDGTAFLVRTSPLKGQGQILITPNKGKNWYKLANVPEFQGTATNPDLGGGATLQRETLIIFMYAQIEPWVYGYWRAEIPLATLEGLSP